MASKKRIDAAVQACKGHARDFRIEVPERLIRFWSSGDAFRHDRACLPPDSELPLMQPGSFRLAITVPSWSAQSSFGPFDDAVVGKRGDWKGARLFLPLFAAESGVVVARLDSEDCPIGWFTEGMWDSDDLDAGYRDGVYGLADSLDEFLKRLVALDRATWEHESDERMWTHVE